jgi:hypothetical protein
LKHGNSNYNNIVNKYMTYHSDSIALISATETDQMQTNFVKTQMNHKF